MSLTNKSPTIFVFPLYPYCFLFITAHWSAPYLSLFFCSLETIYQTNSVNMDNNYMDDYVLVLDDHTEVKNEAEVGKLLLLSDKTPSGTFSPSQAQWLCGYRTSQRKASPPLLKKQVLIPQISPLLL